VQPDPVDGGGVVVFRGLFGDAELAELYALSADCLASDWGTVRRRSVGLPDRAADRAMDGATTAATPAQTHLRLNRYFCARAPAAWSALRRAAAAADAAHLGGVLAAAVLRRDGEEEPEDAVEEAAAEKAATVVEAEADARRQAECLGFAAATLERARAVAAAAAAAVDAGQPHLLGRDPTESDQDITATAAAAAGGAAAGATEAAAPPAAPLSADGAGMGACFKQADALVYHGAQNGDWVGWHDHGGESVLFAVVLLADPAGFEGGTFCYRRADTGTECTLGLGLGDAVICVSHTEHCVRPVSGGVRFSLNVDFWAVASDNRSDADRY